MAFPYMPLYPGDLLADTLDLTGAEFGAYMLLILAYWTNGGPLPADDRRLLHIARASANPRILQTVIGKYFQRRDGSIVHQRIDFELNKARSLYAKRSLGARTANAKRAHCAPQSAPQPEPEPEPVLDNDEVSLSSKRTPKPRRTRIAEDWTPSAEDRNFAVEFGLTDAEITDDAIEFREYWRSGDAKSPNKVDWSRTYRNHVRIFGPSIIRRRSGGNGSRPDGILATFARAAARMENGMDQRRTGNGGGSSDDAGRPGKADRGAGRHQTGHGTVIDHGSVEIAGAGALADDIAAGGIG